MSLIDWKHSRQPIKSHVRKSMWSGDSFSFLWLDRPLKIYTYWRRHFPWTRAQCAPNPHIPGCGTRRCQARLPWPPHMPSTPPWRHCPELLWKRSKYDVIIGASKLWKHTLISYITMPPCEWLCITFTEQPGVTSERVTSNLDVNFPVKDINYTKSRSLRIGNSNDRLVWNFIKAPRQQCCLDACWML